MKKTKKIITLLTLLSIITAIFLDLIDIKKIFSSTPDTTGEWIFNFKIDSSSYKPYLGKIAKYKVHIIQKDDYFRGEGEKFEFNSKKIQHSKRDVLVFEGKIQNDSIYCSYRLRGKIRTTTGNFKGHIFKNTIQGSFSGTGADAKGKFSAQKK